MGCKSQETTLCNREKWGKNKPLSRTRQQLTYVLSALKRPGNHDGSLSLAKCHRQPDISPCAGCLSSLGKEPEWHVSWTRNRRVSIWWLKINYNKKLLFKFERLRLKTRCAMIVQSWLSFELLKLMCCTQTSVTCERLDQMRWNYYDRGMT